MHVVGTQYLPLAKCVCLRKRCHVWHYMALPFVSSLRCCRRCSHGQKSIRQPISPTSINAVACSTRRSSHKSVGPPCCCCCCCWAKSNSVACCSSSGVASGRPTSCSAALPKQEKKAQELNAVSRIDETGRDKHRALFRVDLERRQTKIQR